MNRRTLKKHCRRAMEVLIRAHGYRPRQFHAADGDESVDAPPGMEKRFVRNGFLEPGPLKGTYLLVESCDCLLPSEVLREIEFWSSFKLTEDELITLLNGTAVS